MISWLNGVIIHKETGRVVLNVNGVGYEALIPLSTYYELGEVGTEAVLQIHTHVKEDALSLYGFLTQEEKRLFLLLIQISGVGPKLGIGILSGLGPNDFVQAIVQENEAGITAIPGVGKKTAQRLILEMRDKVGDWEQPSGESTLRKPMHWDVVSALVNLGHPRKEAERRVKRILKEHDIKEFEPFLKLALRPGSRR